MTESEFAEPSDALAYDAWENPDVEDLADKYLDDQYDADLDHLHPDPLELAAADGLKSAVRDDSIADRSVDVHHTWEQELTADADGPSPAPRRADVPRLAGHNRPRRGEILLQRTRVQVGDFVTDDELRVFLAEQTEWEWADLVRPTPRGRLTATEQRRREELARLVGIARSRGAAFETLAQVLNRSLATVHALASSASA